MPTRLDTRLFVAARSTRLALPVLTMAATLLWSLADPSLARADENRRGLQLEGMVGVGACIPGRAPCRQDNLVFSGSTKPSLGAGVAFGVRPFRWLLVGGLYRWGMFEPRYRVDDGVDYPWAGQHTVAAMLRPILPIWRFDLGLNIAPGFARQTFRRDVGKERDYSRGFAFLVGPTVDVFVTERFFLGAEVDFIFSTTSKVCERRAGGTTCFEDDHRPLLTPTHQVLFGLHIGGTFL